MVGVELISSRKRARGGPAAPLQRDERAPLPSSEYRADLQGLRAVAVLLVALDHADVRFLKGGYVGVDVFFVLSGYLITGLLLAGVEKRGYVSLTDFYARRARRILPAAALTLVVTTVVAYHLLNYVRAKQAAWDSFWAALFAANIHFAHVGADYFARGQPPSVEQHYWSLSVEEQFYLVWPALLSVALFGTVGRRRTRSRRRARGEAVIRDARRRRLLAVIVAATAASLVWSIHETGVAPAPAYFSPFTRAWELGLGAALAVAALRMPRVGGALKDVVGWAGIAAIAAAAVLFSDGTAFPGYAALLPTVGAALVIAAGIGRPQPRLGAGRLLAVAPMRYIGDRSYSFYLWHWPVLTIAVLYEGHELEVGVKLLLLLGAFGLSVLTYRFFENPIRRARWDVRTSAVLIPVSVAAVLVVATYTISSLNAKILRVEGASAAFAAPAAPATPALPKLTKAPHVAQAPSLPGVIAAVKAARRGAKIPAGLTPPVSKLEDEAYQLPSGCAPASDSETTSNICHLGATSATKSIVVFGDSHAEMWMPTILAMAQADSWNVIPMIKSGCVTSSWTGQGYTGTSPALISACHTWYRWAVQQTKALHPDVTLMAGCCGGADGSVAASMERAYPALAAALKGASKTVILVADDDGIAKQPIDCLLASHATMKTCTTTATAVSTALNNDLKVIAKRRGFGFMNTRGWFCYQNQCPMVVGHTLMYRDTGHITQTYALKLAVPFRAAFRRCIFDVCPA